MRAAWLCLPLLLALWPDCRGANINQELYGRVCTVYVLYCTVQELYGSDSPLGARRPILDPGTLDRDGLEVGADSWAEASQVCAGIYLDIVISTFIPRRS